MIPSSEPAERCAVGADRRGDPMLGTAPQSTRWLLVEQPGPWGRDALLQSRLDPAVGAGLELRAARTEGLRVLLIRRPGRPDREVRPRRWAYAASTDPLTRWGEYDDPRELLELPLDASAGVARAEATYLVCAHGRHDACCAIRGRNLAAAMAIHRAADVWECSHVGGDRFAPNVVVLPHGLYYGQVPLAEAAALIAATEAGEVEPRWLRGRSGAAPAAQAAEVAVRQRLDIRATTGVHVIDMLPAHDGWDVGLRAAGQRLVVSVALHRGPGAARLTCAASAPLPVPAWEARSIRVTPASQPTPPTGPPAAS